MAEGRGMRWIEGGSKRKQAKLAVSSEMEIGGEYYLYNTP